MSDRRRAAELGAEGGQDASIGGDAAGIEMVEVVDHGGVGRLIGGDGFGMADADSQQEAVTVPGGEALVGPGDVGWVVGPHIDDGGGDGDGVSGVEDPFDEGEVADRCPAEPEPGRWKAERLGFYDEIGAGFIVVAGVGTKPRCGPAGVRCGGWSRLGRLGGADLQAGDASVAQTEPVGQVDR